MDPMEDPDDILRANRSREKSYVFDVAFDFTATQVSAEQGASPGPGRAICHLHATAGAPGEGGGWARPGSDVSSSVSR